jgi:hypothetical protein
MDKSERKKLKNFYLEKKVDYIMYLQELIIRLDFFLIEFKEYKEELNKILGNAFIKQKEVLDYKIYARYRNLICGVERYIYNLIGDMQSSSLSYARFRYLINKKIDKNKLDFEIRLIDDETEKLIKEFTNQRIY